MTERQKQVLELIRLKNSILNIKASLNISDRELIRTVRSLCDKGYNIENKYLLNEGHFLQLADKFIRDNVEIDLSPDYQKISFIAISDTHLLSKYEEKQAIDKIYDYTAKENIKYVFHMGDFIHGGDFIDGYNFNKNKFEKLLKEYPKDNDIVTFLVLGNHDLRPIQRENYNIENVIKKSRLDIVPIGYNKRDIKVGSSIIELCHKEPQIINHQSYPNIILNGHRHIYKVNPYINSDKINSIHINIPSVSNMILNKESILQNGFVRLNLTINQKKFKELNIEQFAFLDKMVKVSEYNHQFKKIKR